MEDGKKEHRLFDCCIIKLFINGIWEQAESSFLKSANNSIRNRERCIGRENREAARLLIGIDGALSGLPKDAGLFPLSFAGGRGRKRREIWLLQDLYIDKEKIVTFDS